MARRRLAIQPRPVGWHEFCRATLTRLTNVSFYARYIDKHAAKEFVRARVPTLRVPTTVGYWTNASSLTSLRWRPTGVTELVFKASHLSGGVMLVRANSVMCIKAPCMAYKRSDSWTKVLPEGAVLTGARTVRVALQTSCGSWLQTSYGNTRARLGRHLEKPLYQGVPHGCLLEEAIERDLHGQLDIKVFCFGRQPTFLMVRPINRRFLRNTTRRDDVEESIAYYTTGWQQLRMYEQFHNAPYEGHERPPYLQALLKDAARLASGFDSVRVDFLASAVRYAFNELTFSHHSCAGGTFVPEPLDLLYGSLASTGRGLSSGGSLEEQQLRIVARHERTFVWRCDLNSKATPATRTCIWARQHSEP